MFNFSKHIAQLKRMTANNDHGGAYELAATILGFDVLAAKFSKINREHIRIGYLDTCSAHERYELYQQLMSDARKMMTDEQYKKFYACF